MEKVQPVTVTSLQTTDYARTALYHSLGKRHHEYKRSLLKGLITYKHIKLREVRTIIYDTKETLKKNAHTQEIKCIDEVINDQIKREKNAKEKEHEGKFEAAIKRSAPRPGQTGNNSNGKNDTNHANLRGVIVYTAGTFNNEALDPINNGPKFKISPQNLTQEKFKLRIATERLACAIRYANPTRPLVAPIQNMPSISKQVLKHFDKTAFPPYNSYPHIEKDIKTMKFEVNKAIESLTDLKIRKNVKSDHIKPIRNIGNNPHIKTVPSDKTGKTCLMDRTFVSGKIIEITHNGAYELLGNKDTSEGIENKAKQILEIIMEDTSIPPHIEKHLYSTHTMSPRMKCFMKDHKDTFPHCKVRPVQPVKGSAIEKFDIILSKILGQLSPFLTYRIFNSKEFQDKIKGYTITEGQHMISLDLEGMYENLPNDRKAMEVIELYLEKYVIDIDTFGWSVTS